jgi:hypothetical protein
LFRDISYLLNGGHRNAAAEKAAAKLIERGLADADASHTNNIVTKMLQADYSYLKAWGIGTDQNTALAVEHANLAGGIRDHFRDKLLTALRVPKNG